MEVSKIVFDEFLEWLKQDGLPPRKSERLWRKTIFSRIQNDDPMTIENFHDFKVSKYINIAEKMNGVVLNGTKVQKVLLDDDIKSAKVFFENGKQEIFPIALLDHADDQMKAGGGNVCKASIFRKVF